MTHIDELIGHLGAALMQSIPSDDQIIMDHVREAERIAKSLRVELKALAVPPTQGKTP
jgi:hypothetical protein